MRLKNILVYYISKNNLRKFYKFDHQRQDIKQLFVMWLKEEILIFLKNMTSSKTVGHFPKRK